MGLLLSLACGDLGWCSQRILELDLSPGGQAALLLLLDAEHFADAQLGVSIDGLPPREVRAMQLLAAEARAADAFALLIRRGSRAGSLFGVCGLRAVDPQALSELSPALLTRRGKVATRYGCIRGREGHAEILEQILVGDLSARVLPR